MMQFGPRTRVRRWQWTAVGLMCAAVGIYLLFCRATPPAQFILLGQPYAASMSARDRFESCLPRSTGWAWIWGVEQTLLGKRAPVNVSAEVISLADSSPALLSSLALGPPSFSTNGLEIWLLEAKPLKALRERFKSVRGLEVLSRPRISTADGIGCTMFQGESIAGGAQVGLEFGCHVRTGPHSTDLMTSVTFSEMVTNQGALTGSSALSSIQTNLNVAVRVQVPEGNGLLLLDRSSAVNLNRKRVGLLMDPLQPKK